MRMIKFLIIIAIGLIFTLCFGCSSRLNKDYDYKTAQYNFNEGELIAKLIGTFKSYEKETLRTAPYELFIAVESNTVDHDAATLKGIELKDTKSGEIVFTLEDSVEEKFISERDGSFCAYFSFKDLTIKYVRYKLVLDFEIKGEKSKIEKKIILYFDKDYKEHRSNDFIDKLMSV